MIFMNYEKSQSAMEYLMTYGWAILIIAVVLGALFQLGVFSGIGTPRAQPGNCQVVKVGTGITQTISLAGECQGQQPEYVAQFNGQYTSNVLVTTASNLQPSSITLAGWSYVANMGSGCSPQMIVSNLANSNGGNGRTGASLGDGWGSDVFAAIGNSISWLQPDTTSNPSYGGRWILLAVTYNSSSGNSILYEDNMQLTAGHINQLAENAYPYVVGGGCESGYISNVQIYNTSLSPSEVNALYLEGIGGAPINPQYIVGWWPLNGNAQDYSGNNNNGQATGITYSSSWSSGYTAP